jgi:prophage regulatory protein
MDGAQRGTTVRLTESGEVRSLQVSQDRRGPPWQCGSRQGGLWEQRRRQPARMLDNHAEPAVDGAFVGRGRGRTARDERPGLVSGRHTLSYSQATIVVCMAEARLHLMGAHEIRVRLGGVSRQRTYQITSRADFPEPLAELEQGKVWRAEDVEAWISAHRTPPS